MKINYRGWSKRTETIKEEYNYIHGNNHLIERVNSINKFRPFYGSRDIYQPIYNQLNLSK